MITTVIQFIKLHAGILIISHLLVVTFLHLLIFKINPRFYLDGFGGFSRHDAIALVRDKFFHGFDIIEIGMAVDKLIARIFLGFIAGTEAICASFDDLAAWISQLTFTNRAILGNVLLVPGTNQVSIIKILKPSDDAL